LKNADVASPQTTLAWETGQILVPRRLLIGSRRNDKDFCVA